MIRRNRQTGGSRAARQMTAALTMLVALVVVASGVVRSKLPSEEPALAKGSANWTVYFSPKGGATQAIVNALNRAERSVLVQAYSFTSVPIAKALLNAHKRGVSIKVILDSSQRSERYSEADFLANSGISTKIDDAHAIAHNKVMIIDGRTVITGSFNFTKSAEERNAENLLIINDRDLASRYTKNWRVHEKHSEAYAGKGKRGYKRNRYRSMLLNFRLNFGLSTYHWYISS